MKLGDVIRYELFFCNSEIISRGETPGWPRAVINFRCLGCNHHSEKRLRVGMIDDGQEGDGLWTCSTSPALLIAGSSSGRTSLNLPGMNKATCDLAVFHSRRSLSTTKHEPLKLKRFPLAFRMCLQKEHVSICSSHLKDVWGYMRCSGGGVLPGRPFRMEVLGPCPHQPPTNPSHASLSSKGCF